MDNVDGDGTQVSTVSALVLETSICVNAGDTAGRMTAKLTGEGKGTWQACAHSLEPDGPVQPLPLRPGGRCAPSPGPGKSYICIINPWDSTLTFSCSGDPKGSVSRCSAFAPIGRRRIHWIERAHSFIQLLI